MNFFKSVIFEKKFYEKENYLLRILLIFLLFSFLRGWPFANENIIKWEITFNNLFYTLINGVYNFILCLIPVLFFRKKIKLYWISIITIAALSNLINFIHLFQYKTPISMGAFAVIFETNPQESSEFFRLLNIKDVLIAIILAFLPFFLLIKFKIKTDLGIKSKLVLITILFFFSSILIILNHSIKKEKINFLSFSFTHSYLYEDGKRIAYYIREKRHLNNLRKKRADFQFAIKNNNINEKQVFVLVIGESASRHHMGLYGYKRNTTPYLDTLKNLYVFNNVISPSTQTRTAIMNILTLATVKNMQLYYEKGSIITAARNAGFSTYWISNQMKFGISDTDVSVIADDSDETFYLNIDWHTNSLDEKILPVLDKILAKEENKQFIIVHLLGSHFDYFKRYRDNPEFVLSDNYKFPDYLSREQKKTIDEYDNSIRYTDYVLYSIIKQIQNLDCLSAVIYLSDHAEEVYDTEKTGIGHGSPLLSKYVVDIPFIIWFSDIYLNLHNSLFNKPTEYLERSYSTENLFHTLSDLMYLHFPEYDSTKSLVNENYKAESLFVLNSENTVIKYEDIKK